MNQPKNEKNETTKIVLYYFISEIGFRNFSFFPFGFYFPWSFGFGFTPSNFFFLTFLFLFGFAPFHLPHSVLFSFWFFSFLPANYPIAEEIEAVTNCPHMYLYELKTPKSL